MAVDRADKLMNTVKIKYSCAQNEREIWRGDQNDHSQLTLTCLKLTIETLENGMEYVQS